MAYIDLTTQVISKSGIVPTYAAATLADGNKFRNTGKEFIHVVNAGGSACIVTMVTPAQISGLDIEDKIVTVAAGSEQMIGTFEPSLYNQAAGATDAGKTYIKYNQVTTVTVAVIRS